MRMASYLSFDGRCEEAIGFYAKTLNAKVGDVMRYAGSPMEGQVPAEWRDKVMHSELVAGDQRLMASDSPPGRFEAMHGMHVALSLDTVAEANRVFAAFADGGAVKMPIAPTFWAAAFGVVTDKFGTPWLISCEHQG